MLILEFKWISSQPAHRGKPQKRALPGLATQIIDNYDLSWAA
jgi:hypothetical protein